MPENTAICCLDKSLSRDKFKAEILQGLVSIPDIISTELTLGVPSKTNDTPYLSSEGPFKVRVVYIDLDSQWVKKLQKEACTRQAEEMTGVVNKKARRIEKVRQKALTAFRYLPQYLAYSSEPSSQSGTPVHVTFQGTH